MTIRNRLALRFTGLVSSIIVLAFVIIYTFCWYFITSDFYRRLDRKANTTGDMLIRHRIDAELIHQFSRVRKDQLPGQTIIIFDTRDSAIFQIRDGQPRNARSTGLPANQIGKSVLAGIRQDKRRDFQLNGFYVSGTRFMTASGQFVVVASAKNSYGDVFLRRLAWSLTGLFGLIAGITAFSGWVFAGDALRPMQRIDQVLSDIFPRNRDGRLTVAQEDDEISRLSATINQLLDRVSDSFRLQRVFVANVSHELKNPLTQISSQLEVSLLNQREPEAYRQTIRSVLDDVGDLSTLTRELLQLSQVNQDDAVDMLTDVVRLDEIVWDLRDEVTAINPRYRVSVELGTLPDEPDQLAVQGNRTLLAAALKNLTENACKFAPNGHARVRVDFGADAVSIHVENTGRAIPEADQPYIFEPFYRSRQAGNVRGYGVGLSLVARIIRLHAGQIHVHSVEGQPTVFSVVLPRRILSRF